MDKNDQYQRYALCLSAKTERLTANKIHTVHIETIGSVRAAQRWFQKFKKEKRSIDVLIVLLALIQIL